MIEVIKLLTILIFILTYIFLVIYYNKKTLIVWIGVILLILIKSLTVEQAFLSIDWNVMFLYIGMLIVSGVFIFSKMPDYLASLFVSKSKSVVWAMVVLCAFSGFLSIFLENVAVVLIVAPIAISIANKLKINPLPLFTGVAICSNLQGSATLIGDPPSMMLASFANLRFNDFFFIGGRPSIFFAVQIGFIASLILLYFIFKKYDKKMHKVKIEKYRSIIPSILLIMLILSLIFGSIIFKDIDNALGIICLSYGAVFLIWYIFHVKINKVEKFLLRLDWQTGIFLIGIFILVESLNVNGILNDLAQLVLYIGNGNPVITYFFLIIVTVIATAFVDNIPFLLSVLPITKIITESINVNPLFFYFSILLAVTVGGNISPVGASANIVAMGFVKKQGHKIKFMDFVKIGLPFTLIALLFSLVSIYLFLR